MNMKYPKLNPSPLLIGGVLTLFLVGAVVFNNKQLFKPVSETVPAVVTQVPETSEPEPLLTTGHTDYGESAGESETAEIEIKDSKYLPQTLTVQLGTIVIFENEDKITHKIISSDANFESDDLTYEQKQPVMRASEIGTFNYHCKYHPQEKGTIVVTE